MMAEELTILQTENKKEAYDHLVVQLRALVADEPDATANLANIAAALRQTFPFFWVGFYLVQGDELVLGPFQGPVACTRIAFGKGVCGAAWAKKEAILVPDVDKFPGHIACSTASRSEVVVPVFRAGEVVGVLDVDSDRLNDFDQYDVDGLKDVANVAASVLR